MHIRRPGGRSGRDRADRAGRATGCRDARWRLLVVALAIVAATLLGLPALGVPITGEIPPGLPCYRRAPALRPRDVEGIVPLAAGALLLAYIEGVSAARTFAAKHGYAIDPRQEFLGIGAANLAAALGQGYPVAGGLSQSAVNDKAGAEAPLALVIRLDHACDLPALPHRPVGKPAEGGARGCGADGRRRADRFSGCCMHVARQPDRFLRRGDRAGRGPAARDSQGILLAALASILLLLLRASRPHVAFLGRIPGTRIYSDMRPSSGK